MLWRIKAALQDQILVLGSGNNSLGPATRFLFLTVLICVGGNALLILRANIELVEKHASSLSKSMLRACRKACFELVEKFSTPTPLLEKGRGHSNNNDFYSSSSKAPTSRSRIEKHTSSLSRSLVSSLSRNGKKRFSTRISTLLKTHSNSKG